MGKGKAQIWLLPSDGGEARQLTFLPHGASAPVWSPDGQALVFTALVGPLDEETEDGKPLPKVRVIDRLWYRLDGVGYIHDRRSHLFLISVGGGEPVQLTDGDWDESDPAWSPDGAQLAFVSSRAEDRWRMPAPDVYTLAIKQGRAGTQRRLTDGTPELRQPSLVARRRVHRLPGCAQVALGVASWMCIPFRLQAEQAAATNLTEGFEGSFQDWTNTDADARDEHIAPAPVWSSNGQILYALASHHGATRVFVLSSSQANLDPVTLTPGPVQVRDFSLDHAREHLALLIGSATRPPELFLSSSSAGGDMTPGDRGQRPAV